MVSSSIAWPSVIVKRGPSVVVGRKFVKAEWSNMFGELLVYGSGLDCVCMYFPLATVRVFVHYICLISLHDYERQPASKVG